MLKRLARGLGMGSQRSLVGEDLQGNKYFLADDGSGRRTMEFANKAVQMGDRIAHIDAVPVQWRRWLSHGREIPPTLEELREFERSQVELRVRVAELEEIERQEKIQAALKNVKKIPLPEAKESGGMLNQLANSVDSNDPSSRMAGNVNNSESVDEDNTIDLEEIEEFDPSK